MQGYLNYLIIFLLIFIFINGFSQSLSKIRKDKKYIHAILKKNKTNDKNQLKKYLKLFSLKSLQQFVKDYDLPYQKKNKSELLKLIIKNINFLVLEKSEGKLKVKEKRFEKGEINSKKDKENGKNINKRRLDELEELEKKTNNNFLTYKAHKMIASNKKDKKGYRQILLFGLVEINFKNKTLYSDTVKIKIDENDNPIEIVAEGDLLLIDENKNTLSGSKIIFYPQLNRTEIFKSEFFYKNTLFLKSDGAKQIAKNKYILNKGFITSDNLINPHWKINYSKAWFYHEKFLWAQNAVYKVGNTPLIYTPIFFRSDVQTGIRTALAYRRGMEWFLNNTFTYVPGISVKETHKAINLTSNGGLSLKGNHNFALKVKLDYYQRLGLYFGTEILYRKGSNKFLFDSAIAIDRSLRFKKDSNPPVIENYFDQDNDGLPEETNNFRWRIKSEGQIQIFSNKYFRSVLSATYKNQAEPHFQNQFEERRRLDFDLIELSHIRETKEDVDVNSAYASKQPEINFELKNKLFGVYVNFKGDFNYSLKKDKTNITNPPVNPYLTNFYKNYKSIFNFPILEISYSHYFKLFGDQKPILKSEKEKKQKEQEKKQKEFIKELNPEKKNDSKKINTLDENDENLDPNEYLTPEIMNSDNLKFNLPLILNLKSHFEERKSYKTDINNDLDIDAFHLNNKIDAKTPFSLTYQFLTFNMNPSAHINYKMRQTKNATSLQKTTDKELSYFLWGINISNHLKFHFLKEYKYLELTFGIRTTYSKNDRFDEIIKENNSFKNESGRSESFRIESYLNFFKTKINISFNDNIYILAADKLKIDNGEITKEDILKKQRGNLNIVFESNILDFIKLSNILVISRKDEKDENNKEKSKILTNNITIGYKFLNNIHLFSIFYINKLVHTFTWKKDFNNELNDYLESNFNINFNLTKNWTFIFNVKSINRELFRYTEKAKKYGYEPKNFFTDLLDSFNFFDISARKRSLFNIDSLNFSLLHDLHSWIMEFKLNLNLKQFKDKEYYFEPTIYFIIFLKDFKSFHYPKIDHTFSRQ